MLTGVVTTKRGHTAALVVVDKFSNMTRFATLKTEATPVGITVQGSATSSTTLATPDSCSAFRVMVRCQTYMPNSVLCQRTIATRTAAVRGGKEGQGGGRPLYSNPDSHVGEAGVSQTLCHAHAWPDALCYSGQ